MYLHLSDLQQLTNQYFFSEMQNIFVDRYFGLETFEQYLSHRYKTNCYFYSAYAVMGLKSSDLMVRGDIRLDKDSFWADGGYGHGWVEFTYDGKTYVFDSRCKEIMQKELWYQKFEPQNMIKFTQEQLLSILLSPDKSTNMGNLYQVRDLTDYRDVNFLERPFRRAIVSVEANTMAVQRFIGFSEIYI